MASNITVSISAETAALTAGVAQAQAAMRDFGAQVRTVANDIQRSAGVATDEQKQKLLVLADSYARATATAGAYKNAIATLNAPVREAAAAHEQLSLATAGSTREIIVLAHEMVSGNFSRLPGSVMVLTERMGGLHGALLGTFAAVGAVGLGMYEFVRHIIEATEETNKLQGALNLLGRGGDMAAAQKDVQALRDGFAVSRTEANAVVGAIENIPRATNEARAALERYSAIIADASKGTLTASEVATELAKAATGGASAIEQLGQKWDLFSAEQLRALAAAQGPLEAEAVLMDALGKRFDGAEAHARSLKDIFGELMMAASGANQTVTFAVTKPETGPPPDEGRLALLQVENRYNAELLREHQLKQDIATLDKAIANSSAADEGRFTAERAKAAEELAALQNKGQASELAQFRQNLAEMQASFVGTHEQMLQASLRMWDQEIASGRLAAKELTQANTEAANVQRQINEQQVRDAVQSANNETRAREEAFRQQMTLVKQSNTALLAEIREANDGSRAGELRAEASYWQERIRLAQQGSLEEIQAQRGLATANRQLANEQQQAWSQSFTKIKQPFDQLVRGVLTGSETMGQALRNMWTQVALSAIENIGNITLEYIAQSVIQLATGKAAASSEIKTHAASAAAAVYDDVAQIPYVGWLLAPPAAAAAFAAVAAFGGSFDQGSMGIPHDMMAQVHQGEIVVPASFSDAIRSGQATLGGPGGASGSSGPAITIQLAPQVQDAQSFQQYINNPTTLRTLATRIMRFMPQNPQTA